MSDDPDRQLVEDAKSGDEIAFETLWHRYKVRITAIVRYRLSGSPFELFVDDIVQEIFHRAFRSIRSFRAQAGAKFSTWLCQIARNRCSDCFRVKPREHQPLDEACAGETDPRQPIDEFLAGKESADQVWESMSEREREFVTMLSDGYSRQEIADALSMTVNEIYVMTRKLKQRRESSEALVRSSVKR